jgi:hypothetical protein
VADRPRSIGGVVRRGVELWAQSAITLWGVLVPLAVLFQLAAAIAMISSAPSGSTVINGTIFVPAGAGTGSVEAAHLVGIALTALSGLLGAGVALRIFSAAAAGSSAGAGAALRFASSRFGGLVWLGILYGAVVAGGVVLLALPGIYIAVACTAALPVLVLEDKRGLGALTRARELSKGRWWATLGAMAPSWLLAAGGGLLITTTLRVSGTVTTYALTQALGWLVIQVLLVPIGTAASLAVYLDLRARREPIPLRVAGLAAVAVPSPGPGRGEQWWS